MQDFPQLGVTLVYWWLGAYIVLAGIYLLFGCVVSSYNRKLSGYRIQNRTCSQEQVRRDFFKSLTSLISISAIWAVGMALRQVGVNTAVVDLNLASFVLWGIISLLLFDTWFYWMHRLVHHKRLYKSIHRWHHRAVTPTVWSNNSDTLLDNLLLQSYWFFALLLLPAPTLVLVAHKIHDQISGMLGHAGYEYAPGAFYAKPSPLIGTSFHDQHHAYFRYNFATHFSIWDRLMGTLHPDYDRLVTSFPRKPQR